MKWANCIGIIMKCVDSGNLEDLLMSNHVAEIPWVPRTRFVYEIADALSYLHYYDETKSFVHGDLKPQNIPLTSDLTIKIAVFWIGQCSNGCRGVQRISRCCNKYTTHSLLHCSRVLEESLTQKNCKNGYIQVTVLG
ncbi:unnamed protein product [Clavelina lepadiformis]|uniref:Protein kinase domain-containing protein n=1 Tax=Clavelina lepadiformis TaxID=159417 RepID=A0ABP0G5I4_CLALP